MHRDLRLEGVGRRYGLRGPWVLRGVDLTVAPGDLVRVGGANGTGKSTLLRLLAGIDAPSEGRVSGRPRTEPMTALLRYQAALLLRSQRWLPPLILYAAFLAIGVQGGQPVLDSLGYAAAALLPVAAWLVRICVTGEPPAARACVSAAVGPARAHLACLLVALAASAVLGAAATLAVTVISDPASSDHATRVPLAAACGAGLLAALACALLGTAVGALTSWPLLRSPGGAVPSLLLAALLALVMTGSPAQAAVSGLVTGSQSGTVPLPLLPLATAALLTATATAAACTLTSRRSP